MVFSRIDEPSNTSLASPYLVRVLSTSRRWLLTDNRQVNYTRTTSRSPLSFSLMRPPMMDIEIRAARSQREACPRSKRDNARDALANRRAVRALTALGWGTDAGRAALSGGHIRLVVGTSGLTGSRKVVLGRRDGSEAGPDGACMDAARVLAGFGL